MNSILENIINQYSYSTLFLLSFSYFLFLYFIIGKLFLKLCEFFESKNIVEKIIPTEIKKEQISFEIKHSIISIIIFSISFLPIIYLIRTKQIILLQNSFLNIFLGLLLLSIWNEIHFYLVHKFMHSSLMIKFHSIHHKSITPSIYAVFSFHWLEALLLSTIQLTIIPFFSFSIIAFFIYPLVSILLNLGGHCNYRFVKNLGFSFLKFGTRHNKHHRKGKNHFSFTLKLLDTLFSKKNKL